MKKVINITTSKTLFGFVFFMMSVFSFNAYAQTMEITPSYGYQFGSKLNYGNNYIKMEGSDQFGITVGVDLDDVVAELSYFHQGTELRIRDNIWTSGREERLADLSIDWIMLGAMRYFDTGKVKPFAGGALGMAIFSPKNQNYDIQGISSIDSRTRFAFSFKVGVNYMFTDYIGLNLQGNIMLPVNWGGYYVGTGGGGVAVSSTTVIGGFSGGLVFVLN